MEEPAHKTMPCRKNRRLTDRIIHGYPVGIRLQERQSQSHAKRECPILAAGRGRMLLLARMSRMPGNLPEALPGTNGTLATVAGDAKFAAQILERSRAFPHCLAHLAFCDGFANADVHRGPRTSSA